MLIETVQYTNGIKATSPSWEALVYPESTSFDQIAELPVSVIESEHNDELRHACDKNLVEQVRLSFEAGQEQGFNRGRLAERDASAANVLNNEQKRMQHALKLVENFRSETDRYLEAVESEVVRLALAVAARILRREAQMDPLLLTGAVRVALRQLSSSTTVKLIVPPDDHDLWIEAVEHMPNLPVRPTVLTRDEMRLGDCVIETALGSVDLGVKSQIAEIEREFLDRASTNPITQKPLVTANMKEV